MKHTNSRVEGQIRGRLGGIKNMGKKGRKVQGVNNMDTAAHSQIVGKKQKYGKKIINK